MTTDFRYEPNWDSLQNYEVPQWFMDDKLGIFIHWGPYSVPAFDNEWYPRFMYRDEISRKGPNYHQHHTETWGHPSKFGYKDFIPLFKAENWDPAQWLDLFQKAGARYIVPVAEHHDGFPMFASTHTRWNAAQMGPKRDVCKELELETRAAGLKFGVSSHRAFNWRYYTYADDFDTTHPGLEDLYCPPHPEDAPASWDFLQNWYARTLEMIDYFRPDVLWFDFGWHFDEFEPYRPQVAAYYYNRALEWGSEPVLQYKDKFPDGVAVYDVERGKLDDIRPHYWQTDTAVSYKAWSYIEDDEFKSPATIIHDLVDIVSKNGNLLLNVGPRADGVIPAEATQLLLDLGAWLDVNGEAIYGTRHWERFGEGDTAVVVGHLTERSNLPFTAKDVRFTQKDDALYAIVLGWPGSEAAITSLGSGSSLGGRIRGVSMLGSDEPVSWKQDENALTVSTPNQRPCDHAYTFKIELQG